MTYRRFPSSRRSPLSSHLDDVRRKFGIAGSKIKQRHWQIITRQGEFEEKPIQAKKTDFEKEKPLEEKGKDLKIKKLKGNEADENQK